MFPTAGRSRTPSHAASLRGSEYGVAVAVSLLSQQGPRCRDRRRQAGERPTRLHVGPRGQNSRERLAVSPAPTRPVEGRSGHSPPFDPTVLIRQATSSVTCALVFGERHDYEDRRLLGVVGRIVQLIRSPWGQMFSTFPGLMSYLPGPPRRMFENFEQLRLFVLEQVKRHQLPPQRHRLLPAQDGASKPGPWELLPHGDPGVDRAGPVLRGHGDHCHHPAVRLPAPPPLPRDTGTFDRSSSL
ncbi:uncharacterized protein LOC106732396 [Pelodiscus sinensis]|uniref:uncharacterized protein LOC106732396 n=1 Tax=Pelodiscus sinensis TaxID=13735 RepID=UPI003F6A7557